EPGIGLAHRRLSIIDLAGGDQPLGNEDGSIQVVFNGEIYNYRELADLLKKLGHRFRSGTDTEVILHAYEEWGPECLSRFNGMWAFALWDSRKQELFCARDRFGIKPFYYTIAGGSFLFASEIKALREHPGVGTRPNERLLFAFLAWGLADHTDETMFAGIRQLLPGHSMTVTADAVGQPTAYWNISINPELESKPGSDEGVGREFLDLLTDAVRLHLRADVPVGTCLSGGLDSSALTVLINRVLKEENPDGGTELQNTFSACFPDKRFDESDFIEVIVQEAGVKSHPTYPDTRTIWDDLDHLLYSNDEPFASLTIYSQYCVMREASRFVKVVLDGQGADELLAGYIAYQVCHLRGLLEERRVDLALREIFGILRHHRSFIAYALSQLPVRRQRRGLIKAPADLPFPRYQGRLCEALKTDLTSANLPYMLHWEDRTSMAFSIEARVPYLDYRLVEFLASLPDDQRIRNGVTKFVLRKAIEGIVPEVIRCRMDKRGFSTPEDIWMQGPMREHILEILASESFRARPYWDAGKVLQSYRDFAEGKTSYSTELWRIICAELWLRRFIDRAERGQVGRNVGTSLRHL
ncbi:MAG: asparagine synthase (glutamine-hydrolyzing), partial [Methanomicrobiaceae archaeon]|nr:asparagine synthase (glutamine-hydrolyzing) [Methanomicrobiaceae archaeon]